MAIIVISGFVCNLKLCYWALHDHLVERTPYGQKPQESYAAAVGSIPPQPFAAYHLFPFPVTSSAVLSIKAYTKAQKYHLKRGKERKCATLVLMQLPLSLSVCSHHCVVSRNVLPATLIGYTS